MMPGESFAEQFKMISFCWRFEIIFHARCNTFHDYIFVDFGANFASGIVVWLSVFFYCHKVSDENLK